jgi:hypothetical protein
MSHKKKHTGRSRRVKQRRQVAKTGPVWQQTAEEATLKRMPKFNAHACGTGVHGDTKYNRTKQKNAWKRELRHEEARNRGPLPFYGRVGKPGRVVWPEPSTYGAYRSAWPFSAISGVPFGLAL